MYRIAFFSDFHLSWVDEDFDRALALVWTAVDPEGEVCADHVVIAGDVVDCAQTGVAEEFADSLGEMGLLSSAMLTVVPGNHDVFPVSTRPPFLVPSLPTANWEAFCDAFCAASSRRLIRGEPFPVGKRLSDRVALAALDSTRNGKFAPWQWASGELSEDHADAVRAHFGAQRGVKHRVVVMHHCPWAPYESGENPLFPMGMAEPDHETAVERLKRTGATLVLCGHFHELSGVEEIVLGPGIRGLCAGTAGGADEPDVRAYHVVDLHDDGRIAIAAREYDPFELDEIAEDED